MMTKRFVQKTVIERITQDLERKGFKYKKSDGLITHIYETGFDGIVIKIVDYWPVFQIEMYLRTRIDVVEKNVNLFMEDCMNKDYMRLTPTTNISLNTLSDLSEEYLEVETEEELENEIQKLIFLIHKKGLSFFEHHRDIVEVNNEKKRQILYEHAELGRYHDRRTLMQSLVLMKLCNDTEFEALCVMYLQFYIPLMGQEVTGRKALNDLIEYLRNMKM